MVVSVLLKRWNDYMCALLTSINCVPIPQHGDLALDSATATTVVHLGQGVRREEDEGTQSINLYQQLSELAGMAARRIFIVWAHILYEWTAWEKLRRPRPRDVETCSYAVNAT